MSDKKVDQAIAREITDQIKAEQDNWNDLEISGIRPEYEYSIHRIIDNISKETYLSPWKVTYAFYQEYKKWPEEWVAELTGKRISSKFRASIAKFQGVKQCSSLEEHLVSLKKHTMITNSWNKLVELVEQAKGSK